MRKIFIFSIIVFLVCLGTNGLRAQTPVTAAGDTISTPGNYQVTVDTVDAKSDTSHGIVVYNTNEVNIDGNGKLLLGAGYGPDMQGLYVRTSANSRAQLNVDVTNLTVEGFRHGAYWRVVTGTIDNCTFIDCEKGINFNSRQHPWISGVAATNNIFTNITKMAIEVRGPGAQILDNTFTADKELPKDGIGIALERGWAVADGGYNTTGCLVKGNTINGGGFMKKGLVLDRSIDNTFEDNTITGCSIYGVYLIGSPTIFTTMNTLTNTDITGASGTGVYFRWASGNEFDNLTVANTDFAIVAEDGSVDNILRNSNVPDSIKVVRGSEVTLINTVYDETKFIVEDSSAIKAGYHVTFATQVNGAAVAGSIEVANNAGTVVNEAVVNGAMDVITNVFTSDAATAQGPFVVTSNLNDEGEVYVSTDTIDVASDTTFTFDLERDYSLGYLVMETAGTYTITEDTLDCTLGYDGIRVMANDVTLNGDGKVLMGAGMVTDKQGLYARTVSNSIARLNANASNFIVNGFRHGAYWRIANGTINGNTFIECEKGINANSRQHPLIGGVVMSNNVFTNISKMAIELRGPGAQIINNTFSADHELAKDGIGIAIERGWPIAEGGYSTTGCLIKGNTITGNSFMKKGLMLDRSIANMFEDNVITGCKDIGVHIQGHLTNIGQRATQNVLKNTTITLAAADSAIGVHFRWSDRNILDSLTIANADIGILADGRSQGNLLTNSTILNSSTWDIMVKENSQVFVDDKTLFSLDQVSVEQGSAVFVGGFFVDLSVSLAGLFPTPGAVIVLQNNVGDTLGTGMTDVLGEVQLAVSPIGFSASGFSLDMNPFTIEASVMGNDGVYYAASVTATIVSDTAFALIQTDVPEDVADMPTEFDLSQNYPNPFNPETQISYSLPAPSDVSLKIYNIHGQLINTLVDGRQSAGQKVVVWDARDQFGNGVSSGLYFYVLKAGEFKSIKRMTLLK